MKSRSLKSLFAAILLVTLCTFSSLCKAQLVYSNDFERAIGPEWSNTTTSVTPIGARRFLGVFRNDTIDLSLNNLPLHNELSLSLDWFLIGSWDGNDTTYGPDIMDMSVVGGPNLLHSTFTIVPGFVQAYPDSYPGPTHPPLTGASEIDTLGFSPPYVYGDAVYKFNFTFAHTSSDLEISFAGILNNNGFPDEAWGIDNVSLVASSASVPEPGALALLCAGLFGGWLSMRHHKKQGRYTMRRTITRYASTLVAIVGLMVGFSAISQAQTFTVGQTWDVQAAQLNPSQAIINGFFTVDSLSYSASDESVFNSTLHFAGLTLPGSLDDQFGNSLLFMDYQNADSSWSAQTALATSTKIADQYEFTTPSLGATSGLFVATPRPVSTTPLPPSIMLFGIGLLGMAVHLFVQRRGIIPQQGPVCHNRVRQIPVRGIM